MAYAPLVTIVTPTFNHSDYIGACIRSVIAQSYPNWRQLVIDDGSSDSTVKVAAGFVERRVRILTKSHEGIKALGARYNEALESSQGELVAILEGDDFWPPNKLRDQVRVFEDPHVVLSWGQGQIVGQDNQRIGTVSSFRSNSDEISLTKGEILPKLLLYNFVAPSSGIMIRREVLDRIGGFIQPAGIPYVDLPTWLAVASSLGADDRFVYLRAPMVFWLQHPAQFSRRYVEMITSRADLVTDFIRRTYPQGLTVDPEEIRAIEAIGSFSQARAAIALHRWKYAMKLTADCLKNLPHFARLELTPAHLLLLLTSVTLRLDMYKLLFDLEKRLPTAVSRVTSIARDS